MLHSLNNFLLKLFQTFVLKIFSNFLNTNLFSIKAKSQCLINYIACAESTSFSQEKRKSCPFICKLKIENFSSLTANSYLHSPHTLKPLKRSPINLGFQFLHSCNVALNHIRFVLLFSHFLAIAHDFHKKLREWLSTLHTFYAHNFSHTNVAVMSIKFQRICRRHFRDDFKRSKKAKILILNVDDGRRIN